MSVPICHHLKEDGVYCGSPALNGRDYCYFHLNLRGRRLKAARARRRGDNPPLNLPFPEDMHAVQLCLGELLWALAEQRIDHKAAGLMLYTLQQASTNLNQTPRWKGERKAVENSRPLRALSDPDFEQRFDVPANADLDALRENLCDPPSASSDNCPLTTDNSPVGGPHLPAVGKCGTSAEPSPSGAPPSRRPPDRVPIPEDEFADLKMTRAEEMEFFNYCMDFDTIANREGLQLAWLRAKRSGQLYRSEEGRENSKTFEALFPESGKPEAA